MEKKPVPIDPVLLVRLKEVDQQLQRLLAEAEGPATLELQEAWLAKMTPLQEEQANLRAESVQFQRDESSNGGRPMGRGRVQPTDPYFRAHRRLVRLGCQQPVHKIVIVG